MTAQGAGTDLPARRVQVTDELVWRDQRVHLGFGFDTRGRIREVFIKGGKSGTDVLAMFEDVGVLMSFALQGGRTLADIVAACRRSGVGADMDRPSLAAAIAEKAVAVEAVERDAVVATYGAGGA